MARVLIADDEHGVVDSLERLLVHGGYEVASASTALEAIEALRARHHDLLVTDIQMPGNENLQMLADHGELFEATPVVVITAHPSLDTAVSAVRLPVVDYLLKPIDPAVFLERIGRVLARGQGVPEGRSVASGANPSDLAGLLPEERTALSPRERELLVELARGHAPPELATLLHISPHTVRNHLKSIYNKLGVGSQVELMHRLLGRR